MNKQSWVKDANANGFIPSFSSCRRIQTEDEMNVYAGERCKDAEETHTDAEQKTAVPQHQFSVLCFQDVGSSSFHTPLVYVMNNYVQLE